MPEIDVNPSNASTTTGYCEQTDSIGAITETIAIVNYGVAAADGASALCVTERSPTPLIINLRWVDVETVEHPAPLSTELSTLNLCLQECAGIYWEEPEATQLAKLAGNFSQLTILSSRIVDEAGVMVAAIPEFKPYGEKGHFAIWDGRGLNGFFVTPEKKYQFKLQVGLASYWDEGQTPELRISPGKPYDISIVFRPKNDEDMGKAIKEASSENSVVNKGGNKIMRDCWVEIWRGGIPGAYSSIQVANPFHGHMEATCPGFFTTPKRDYQGSYVVHNYGTSCNAQENYWCRHSSVHLEDPRNQGRISLNIVQPATPLNIPPHKASVEIHHGLPQWTSRALSQGCPTIAPLTLKNHVPYGKGILKTKDGRIIGIEKSFERLKNRQNLAPANQDYLSANGSNFLACVYGGFSLSEFRKLNILIRLVPPAEGSLYDRTHRTPVAFANQQFVWLSGAGNQLLFSTRVRKALTVMKRISDLKPDGTTGTEDLIVAIDSIAYNPNLRYFANQQAVDYPMMPDEYRESRSDDNYRIWFECNKFPDEIWNALGIGQLFLILKVRFAWDWRYWDKDKVDKKFKPFPLPSDSAKYPYLPLKSKNPYFFSKSDDSKRWDPTEFEYLFPIPPPQG